MAFETTGSKMMKGVNRCHGNRVSIQCAGSCWREADSWMRMAVN